MENRKGWVGFDIDRTLAEYHGWSDLTRIGEPIKPMVDKVKYLLSKGVECRIVTARVNPNNECFEGYYNYRGAVFEAIHEWCEEHIGRMLPITCSKDLNMICLYDDLAIQVEPNTGKILGKEFDVNNLVRNWGKDES